MRFQLFLGIYAMKPLLKSLSYIHVFLPFVPFWNISFLILPPKVESSTLAGGGIEKGEKKAKGEKKEETGNGRRRKRRRKHPEIERRRRRTLPRSRIHRRHGVTCTYKTGPKQQKIVPGFDSISCRRSEIGESLAAFSTHTLRSPLQVCLAGSLSPLPRLCR